jgi:hypothetical protein
MIGRVGYVILHFYMISCFAAGCVYRPVEPREKSFIDDCKHCHGEKLQGIHNVKDYCGECHDLSPLPVEKIQVEERKRGVNFEIHVHKTRNIFSGTPSCYFCHKKNDF